ncbi:MAG: hypothetical protein AAFX55_04280, partial [Bacteroidota bacterium]
MSKKKCNCYPNYRTVDLRYNLNIDSYQSVYFGHIHGTTYTIAAKLKYYIIEDQGVRKSMITGTFKSKSMGGLIKFGLKSIGSTPKKIDPHYEIYRIPVILNAFKCIDEVNSSIDIVF